MVLTETTHPSIYPTLEIRYRHMYLSLSFLITHQSGMLRNAQGNQRHPRRELSRRQDKHRNKNQHLKDQLKTPNPRVESNQDRRPQPVDSVADPAIETRSPKNSFGTAAPTFVNMDHTGWTSSVVLQGTNTNAAKIAR